MNRTFAAIFASSALITVSQAFTVTDVSAHQRWPWNNLVDVDFTIGGAAAGDTFKIDVKATYAGGDRTLTAKTFTTDPVVKPGANRVTWDFGADNPGFKAEDLRVAVTATPFTNGTDGVWMVIDLSGGKDATSYPVRYTTTAPVHSVNALDACKTTEMWLKRIKGGSFMFCKGDTSTGYFKVNLTKDYYMGIFECTQQQWAQVTDEWPSAFSNKTWRATRPCESIGISDVFGHNRWPEDQIPGQGSFVANVRARTALSSFNLPTEAQWEWACRCGNAKARHPAYSYDQMRYGKPSNVDRGCSPEEGGTACVGTYKPNPWGLYEIFGNANEMCLDAGCSESNLRLYYGSLMGLSEEESTYDKVEVDDPVGGPRSGPYAPVKPASYHIYRGGSWINSTGNFTNFKRWENPDNVSGSYRGARFVVTCE